MSKSVDRASAGVGTNVTFTLTVSNAAGFDDATAVVVTDRLPSGYTWVLDDSGGLYVPLTGVWSVGAVASGASKTLHITARVRPSGTYLNAAEVTSAGEPDANDIFGNGSGTDFATAIVTALPRVDLSLTKTVDNATPAVGSIVTFTIVVSNAAGFSNASAVVVTDRLPSGYAWVSDDGIGYNPATGVWPVGNVGSGGSRTIHIRARVLGTGSYTNGAEVTSAAQPDINDTYGDGAGNDHATATTTPVPTVDLSLSKTVDLPAPPIGTNVVFTVTVSNAAGASNATGVVVTDRLPGGYAWVSDDAVGNYAPLTGVWSVGAVAPGASRALHITAKVLATGSYTNAAEVTAADQPDLNDVYGDGAGSDFATASTAPAASIDLSLSKTASVPEPGVGTNVVFTLTVSNAAGAGDATLIVVRDRLPSGYAWVQDDGGGAYDPVSGNWNAGSLAAGASKSLNVTATVLAAGNYLNAAEVISAGQVDVDDVYGNGSGEDYATAGTNPRGYDGTVEITDTSVPGDALTVRVVDLDLDVNPAAADSVVVTALNDLTGEIEHVTLVESGPHTGIFAGALQTAPGASAGASDDGTLVTRIDDRVTVTYHDAFTSTRGTADRTATDVVTGIALRVTKLADRSQAAVGEAVAYTIRVENVTSRTLAGVTVGDLVPAGFKFVEGSARILRAGPDGVLGTSDDTHAVLATSGARPVVFGPFGLGGPGAPLPGSGPESVLVRYVLRVGSGAGLGEHVNTATPYLAGTIAGAAARAKVAVTADPTFDLGTIVGKVFEDPNRNGVQDDGEPGIAGAMVALDDGTYALTDAFGRYHIPVVSPGQRLVKLNRRTLPPGAEVEDGDSRILTLTPGIMARASFGVAYARRTVSIDKPVVIATGVNASTESAPIELKGNVETSRLAVNGAEVRLPASDLRIDVEGVDGVLRIRDGALGTPVSFDLGAEAPESVARWALTVYDMKNNVVRTFLGDGMPPSALSWNGRSSDGRLVTEGEVYQVRSTLKWKDGSEATSETKLLGVNRTSLIAIHLAGDAFETGKAELGPKAKQTLDGAADLLRKNPGEKVRIEGHTDDVGAPESNLDLSLRRAKAAMDYLVKDLGLPEQQFGVFGFGDKQPVATNATPEGRAMNRRVEINGQLRKAEEAPEAATLRRKPTVRIDGAPLDVAADGGFSKRLAEAEGPVKVALAGSRGQTTSMTLRVPQLEIQEPRGDIDLSVPDPATCRPVVGAAGEAAARCTLRGRTDPGSTVTVDGSPAATDADGTFRADIDATPGRRTHQLVATSVQGVSRTVALTLDLSDHTPDGRPRLGAPQVPNLTVDLPPEGAKLRAGNLTVSGTTDPGSTILINDAPATVDAAGRYSGTVVLTPGKNAVHIAARDARGREGAIDAVVVAARADLFLMAFADGKFGKLQSKGLVEAAGPDAGKTTYTKGRVAFYLRGTIAGKYLLTSAFDSGTTEYDPVFKGLDGNSARKLLTNLDPDKLYPVYGDGSTVVFDAESQGKFYLALDGDEIHAVVGDYPLSLTDTELAAYQRTLYGARFAYRSVASTRYGAPDTTVVVFGADVKNVHVRDELEATGGSLYYLSRRDVVQGSEEVTLVIRDKNTGLTLSRQRQQQNFDYTVKYDEGRIMFHRPISSVAPSDSIVDPTNLSGDRVFIEVDYETLGDGVTRHAYGARVRQQANDHVAVGATYVKDELSGGSYELAGFDGEVRAGQGTRLTAELAESRGAESIVNASTDGGITFVEKPTGGLKEGRAWKVGADLDVGEWFRRPDRYKVRLYFKDVESGFFASGTTQDQGVRKSGISASLALTGADTLQLRHDREERSGPAPLLATTVPQTIAGASDAVTSSAQWSHAGKGWNLGVEWLDRQTKDATGASLRHSSLGAIRYWQRITDTLSTSIEHQHTISGPANNQTSVGLQYVPVPKLALDARVTDGSLGLGGQLGIAYDFGKSSVYLTERLADDHASRNTTTVLGARSAIGASTRAYSEYQWEHASQGDRQASILGLQKQWDVTQGFKLTVSGEAGQVVSASSSGNRYAVAAGLSYAPSDALTLVSRNEFRVEHGAKKLTQLFTSTQLDYKLNKDFTLQGKYRFSRTEDRTTSAPESRFEEGSIGLAFRPVANDRLNGLARLTHLADLRPDASNGLDRDQTKMDVFSVEGLYEIHPRIEVFAKLAGKRQQQTFSFLTSPVTTNTWLVVDRLNFNLWKPLDLGIEWRMLAQKETSGRRRGFLAELMWKIQKNVRAGVGYNFTDFSDDEFAFNDYRTTGWFVRVQGRY